MPPKSKSLSPIQCKIMLFFLENMGSIDTPRGVATWTEENLKNVREALEELVSQGYLKAHRTSSTVGYSCELAGKKLNSVRLLLNKK